jgi:hypothetical protein
MSYTTTGQQCPRVALEQEVDFVKGFPCDRERERYFHSQLQRDPRVVAALALYGDHPVAKKVFLRGYTGDERDPLRQVVVDSLNGMPAGLKKLLGLSLFHDTESSRQLQL